MFGCTAKNLQAKFSFLVLKFVAYCVILLFCFVLFYFYFFLGGGVLSNAKTQRVLVSLHGFSLVTWFYISLCFYHHSVYSIIILQLYYNIAATCREPRKYVYIQWQVTAWKNSVQFITTILQNVQFPSSLNMVRAWFDLLLGVVFHISISKGITCIWSGNCFLWTIYQAFVLPLYRF